MKGGSSLVLAAVAVLAVACAPAGSGGGQAAGGGPEPARAELARPLVIIVRVEPATVAARAFQQAGTALHVSRRLFNALPALIDDRGQRSPYLLEALPELNTDTWRVFPDGRMETTYRLKASAIWHDGTPLTAEDFVFSWRVYATPDYGHANSPPFHAIEEVTAPDQRTLAIRWKLPYPDAGALSARDRELPPLPRHILQPVAEQAVLGGPDVFTSHPYWTREYMGLGPYRLERWEPGAFFEGVRFEGHVLGAPKIERIRVRFSSDSNTTLANLLAGEVHVATDNSIGQHADTVRREWGPRGGGTVVRWPNAWRHTAFQLRPEMANPRALLDLRVRKALAHAIDKEPVSEAVYGGEAIFADSMIWFRSEWGAATERPIATYAYDLRRSEELMNEAGFARGADGFYASAGEGRFTAGITTQEGPDNVPELLIMAAGFRSAGFDAQESVLPAAQAQDSQVRASFPAMATSNTNMGEPALINLVTERIPRQENRWRGGNRGGWSNPEYDRLVEAFNRTLERRERVELVAQLLQIYAEELPAVPLFFRAQPLAHVAALRGPQVAAPESTMVWNIHEWEFR